MADEVLTLPVRSREDFRKALAGLADPDRKMTPGDNAAFREQARQVVICLCLLWGKELDRKTIWSVIESSIRAACHKVGDGDLDRWLDMLLERVKANVSLVVRLKALQALREQFRSVDEAHRKAFLRWVETHIYAVMAYGHDGWQHWKSVNAKKRAAAAVAEMDVSGEIDAARAAAYESGLRALEEVDLSVEATSDE